MCVALHIFLNVFIYFSWRMIILKHRGGLCHTSIWISHRHTCDPSLLRLLSPPSPPHPLQVVTEHQLWVPCVIHQTPTGYMFQWCSLRSSHPDLPLPYLKVYSLYVSPLLPWIRNCWYYISRFQIYVLIYDIILSLLTYFTLYNRV